MEELAKGSIEKLISMISLMVLGKRCIWSQKQTLSSIMDHLASEIHELREAINTSKNISEIASEMGDILSLSLFLCFIAQREGIFSKDKPAEEALNKLHRRAPFLFDGSYATISHAEAERIWEEAKKKEYEEAIQADY